MFDDELRNLVLRQIGIAEGFCDDTGKWVETPISVRESVAEMLGFPVNTDQDLKRSISILEQKKTRPLDSVQVVSSQRAEDIFIQLDMNEGLPQPLELTLSREDGRTIFSKNISALLRPMAREVISQREFVKFACRLPRLPMGYYQLKLTVVADYCQGMVISSPDSCYRGPQVDKKQWGVIVQAYSLDRGSPWNFGMGDFAALEETVRAVHALGANYLVLSPLFALESLRNRSGYSPYSPTVRTELWLGYIALDRVPYLFESAELQNWLNDPIRKQTIEELKSTTDVPYEEALPLKMEALRIMFGLFQKLSTRHPLQVEYRKYMAKQGTKVLRDSSFLAVLEAERDVFAEGADQIIEKAEYKYKERQLFYCFASFLCDRQYSALQLTARSLQVSLVGDLPVGGPGYAAEFAYYRPSFTRLCIGAPADRFGGLDQEWGLMAPHPFRQRESGYIMFRSLVNYAMSLFDILRVDHIIGLVRFFLFAQKAPTGAFVNYPWNELLAILAIESHRHRCSVVGDDLGTTTRFMGYLFESAGTLGYRIVSHMVDDRGKLLDPERFPEDALVVTSTHDMPPTLAQVTGNSVDIKLRAGRLTPQKALKEVEQLRVALPMLASKLGLSFVPPVDSLTEEPLTIEEGHELLKALFAFTSRCPAKMVAIPLEDLLEVKDRAVNVPGCMRPTYPCWGIKHPLVSIWANDPMVQDLASVLNSRKI